MTDVLMRRDPDGHKDNGHVTSEAETTVLQLEAKEHQGRPVITRGWRKGFSPGAFRESTDLPAPGFGTHSLHNRVTINFCCFKSPSLQYFVTVALETDILA